MFFQAAGDIGSYDLNGVYDLTRYRWLTQDTQVGRFLAGIFGWDPRPSIEQVVAYLAYLIPVLALFFRQPKVRGAGVVDAARRTRQRQRRRRLSGSPPVADSGGGPRDTYDPAPRPGHGRGHAGPDLAAHP